VVQNSSSKVTVVGEVANSLRMPLTPSGERLLDALAAAGGVRQPINKMTLQVTRGSDFYSMPLDLVIRDPKQNVPLRAGDVVTAIFQPLSYTALGSTTYVTDAEVYDPATRTWAVTGSMTRAMGEMDRRRVKQLAYNKEHGITPASIKKTIGDTLKSIHERDYVTVPMAAEEGELYLTPKKLKESIGKLKKKMKEAADKMDFEKAAEYRDRILALERRQIEEGL
jgi:hypothetical protein